MTASTRIAFFKVGLQNTESVTPLITFNISANVQQVSNTITYTVIGDYPSNIPIFWNLTSVNSNTIVSEYFTGNTDVNGSFAFNGSPITIVKDTIPFNAFDETLILNLRPGAVNADIKANVVGGVTQKANIELSVELPLSNTVVFTVTTNMANGTPLYWDLIGNATVTDFADEFGLGNIITVTNNTAIITKELKVLGNKGITRTFYANFRSTDDETPFDTVSGNINIVAANTIVATGGTINTNIDLFYNTHEFSSNATFNVSFAAANAAFDGNVTDVAFLVVGGGGSGGLGDNFGVANAISLDANLNIRFPTTPFSQWNFNPAFHGLNRLFGAGGGGGGGLLSGNTTISTAEYPVVVGRGGIFPEYPDDFSPGAKTANLYNLVNRIEVDGANSSVFDITAIGGGHGGGSSEFSEIGTNSFGGNTGEAQLKLFGGGLLGGAFGSLPRQAGSGGGAGTWYGVNSRQLGGGGATAGQGFAGGGQLGNTVVLAGSGGGGAGEAGFGPTANTASLDPRPQFIGGNGGNGAVSNITGTSITYAGGGAGASSVIPLGPVPGDYGGIGGLGGGGNIAVAGTPGLGGGGGGGSSGGHGTVIVKYLSNARRFSI